MPIQPIGVETFKPEPQENSIVIIRKDSCLIAIHQIVDEIFQSGPEWWTDKLNTDIDV